MKKQEDISSGSGCTGVHLSAASGRGFKYPESETAILQPLCSHGAVALNGKDPV